MFYQESDQQSSSSAELDDVDLVPTKEQTTNQKMSNKTADQSPVERQLSPNVVAMQQYIANSDWSGLKIFVANHSGADLNEPIESGNTVVHYVTESGDLGNLIDFSFDLQIFITKS